MVSFPSLTLVHPLFVQGRKSTENLDADGSIDVLFPVCYPKPNCTEKNEIHVLYNHQKVAPLSQVSLPVG